MSVLAAALAVLLLVGGAAGLYLTTSNQRLVAAPLPSRTARVAGLASLFAALALLLGLMRSEEHTSELQSLMRISYAVFCLKKKKKKEHTTRKTYSKLTKYTIITTYNYVSDQTPDKLQL